MPGVSKEHIRIQAYENSIEVFSDHPQRKYQVIDIPLKQLDLPTKMVYWK